MSDFIDEQWTKEANNCLERGHYKAKVAEWRSWYEQMPNSRVGLVYDYVRAIKAKYAQKPE